MGEHDSSIIKHKDNKIKVIKLDTKVDLWLPGTLWYFSPYLVVIKPCLLHLTKKTDNWSYYTAARDKTTATFLFFNVKSPRELIGIRISTKDSNVVQWFVDNSNSNNTKDAIWAQNLSDFEFNRYKPYEIIVNESTNVATRKKITKLGSYNKNNNKGKVRDIRKFKVIKNDLIQDSNALKIINASNKKLVPEKFGMKDDEIAINNSKQDKPVTNSNLIIIEKGSPGTSSGNGSNVKMRPMWEGEKIIIFNGNGDKTNSAKKEKSIENKVKIIDDYNGPKNGEVEILNVQRNITRTQSMYNNTSSNSRSSTSNRYRRNSYKSSHSKSKNSTINNFFKYFIFSIVLIPISLIALAIIFGTICGYFKDIKAKQQIDYLKINRPLKFSYSSATPIQRLDEYCSDIEYIKNLNKAFNSVYVSSGLSLTEYQWDYINKKLFYSSNFKYPHGTQNWINFYLNSSKSLSSDAKVFHLLNMILKRNEKILPEIKDDEKFRSSNKVNIQKIHDTINKYHDKIDTGAIPFLNKCGVNYMNNSTLKQIKIEELRSACCESVDFDARMNLCGGFNTLVTNKSFNNKSNVNLLHLNDYNYKLKIEIVKNFNPLKDGKWINRPTKSWKCGRCNGDIYAKEKHYKEFLKYGQRVCNPCVVKETNKKEINKKYNKKVAEDFFRKTDYIHRRIKLFTNIFKRKPNSKELIEIEEISKEIIQNISEVDNGYVKIVEKLFNEAKPHKDIFLDIHQGIKMSIINKNRIEFQYRKKSGETSVRTVTPLNLKYYRNSTYLEGYCHLRSANRTFALWRMSKVKILNVNNT